MRPPESQWRCGPGAWLADPSRSEGAGTATAGTLRVTAVSFRQQGLNYYGHINMDILLSIKEIKWDGMECRIHILRHGRADDTDGHTYVVCSLIEIL
jgi:hypothetical protein